MLVRQYITMLIYSKETFEMKCPVVIQHDEMDCGAACLAMVGRYYGIKMPLVKYRDLLYFDNNGTTVFDIIQAAEQLKLNACPLKGTIDKLLEAVTNKQVKLPCIALIKSERYYHYIVIYNIKGHKVKYADPSDGIHTVSIDEFNKMYQNVIISIDKNDDFEKIEYKRKSFLIINNIVAENGKLLCELFLFSIIIIVLSICGSILIEFTINSALNHSDTGFHGADISYDISVEKTKTIVAVFNQVIEILVHKPIIILYILLIVYGLRLAIELEKSFIVTKMACNIEQRMSTMFFDKMISVPLNVFKGKKTGEFITRFTDVRRLNSFLVNIVTTSILNITFVIGFGLFLFLISSQLFVYTFIIVILFTGFTLFFQKIIRKKSFGVFNNVAQVVSVVEESIKGIELIKTYGLEKERTLTFKDKLDNYIYSFRKLANLRFIHNNIANWISGFGNFIIIYMGISMCMNDNLSFSTLLIYYILLSNFMVAVSRLVCIQPELSEAIIAFERIEDVLECESDIRNSVGKCVDCINDLEMQDVGYHYGLRTQVFDNISLKICKGEKILIQGSNGSGKSTLAHILIGNYRDIQGNVEYDGMQNVSLSSIKSNITYLNQDVFLFHDSIFNNIVIGQNNVSQEQFIQICKITGVDEIANGFAEKYDHIICDNGANLSGGQRQKIALARALLRNTPIYIFDESTSNLDENSAKEFLEIVKTYLADKTILIISHNEIFKGFVDKTYLIEKGQIKC